MAEDTAVERFLTAAFYPLWMAYTSWAWIRRQFGKHVTRKFYIRADNVVILAVHCAVCQQFPIHGTSFFNPLARREFVQCNHCGTEYWIGSKR